MARHAEAMGMVFRELAQASADKLTEEGDEYLALLARIAMQQLGEPEREFKLDSPASRIGASLLNLFEGVTVWRQAD